MAKISSSTTIAYLFIVAVVAAPPPPWAGAPAPSDEAANCFSYLAGAGDCLSFVEKGSRLRKPDRDCCPELANLTVTHPVCLCQLLFNSSQFDLSIDTNRALKLPPLCNISIPPLTSCAVTSVPVPSPFHSVTSVPVPSPSAAKGPPRNEDNGSPIIALLPSTHQFLIGLLLLFISVSVI